MPRRAESITEPLPLDTPIAQEAQDYIRTFRTIGIVSERGGFSRAAKDAHTELLGDTYAALDKIAPRLSEQYAVLITDSDTTKAKTSGLARATYEAAIASATRASYVKHQSMPPLYSHNTDSIRSDIVLQLLRDAAAYAQIAYEAFGPDMKPHALPNRKNGSKLPEPILNICSASPEETVTDIRNNPDFNLSWENGSYLGVGLNFGNGLVHASTK
ncbi:MAG TPA: hypothetical protein VF401_04100 [Candidatus Saccharimonadales bacterium]